MGDLAKGIFTFLGAERQAKEARAQAKLNFKELIRLRGEDIRRFRQDPFRQAAAQSLLSRFTNLTPEQSAAVIQQQAQLTPGRAGAELIGVPQPPPPRGPGPVVTKDTSGRKGVFGQAPPPPPPAPAQAPPLELPPTFIQGTDVVTQQQLAGLRSQEQTQAAGTIQRRVNELQQALGSRGITGGAAPGQFFAPTLRQALTDVSGRAAEREIQASQLNRQALLQIIDLFDQFAEAQAGTFA